MVREAYKEAAEFFIQTVYRVPQECWPSPGLGEWTVRDLVGHASRGLTTVETYAAKPANGVDIPQAVDYFLGVRGTLGDPSAVAERGRVAGRELGPQPAATVKAAADRFWLCWTGCPTTLSWPRPSAGCVSMTSYPPGSLS